MRIKKSVSIILSMLLIATASLAVVSADDNLYCLDALTDSPSLEGETDLLIGVSYEFESTMDDATYDYQYFFDWGDGNNTYYIPEDSIPGDEIMTASHAWEEPGDYTVRVRAYRPTAESHTPWTELNVHVNSLKVVGINGGLGISIDIHNYGPVSKDIHWDLSVIGGYLGFHMNEKSSDVIEPVKADTTSTIPMGGLFGLGPFKLNVKLEAGGEPTIEEEYDAFIVFFYVIVS